MGNTTDAENLRKWYINDQKFIYLPIIIEELETYYPDEEMSYIKAVLNAMEKLGKACER